MSNPQLDNYFLKRGLDINPFYQEQAQYNRLINWPALYDSPLKPRFIWIKVAEGTDGESYTEGAAREVIGAKSVGFDAINPYHYYLHRWCDWSTGAAIWREIPVADQALAFFTAAQAANFPPGHPMEDWEDPLIDQFLRWSDTESANRAIAYARKLNAHLKAYHLENERLFGCQVDAYTGAWWLDKWVPLLINNGYTSEVAWIGECYYILADYDGTLNIPDYIPADHVIAWQETSSPVAYFGEPVDGIPTGRAVPGDALDIDRWMRSEAEYNEWCGRKQEGNPVSDRAHFVLISDEDKNVNVPAICKSVDTIGMMMVNQLVDGMIVHKDTGFQTWAGRATKPVVGVVGLDQDLFWKKEIDLDDFKARNMWSNETIRAILDQWRSAPIPASEWAAQHLNITAASGWHDIKALWLMMQTTTNPKHGSQIGGEWQMAIVEDLLKALTPLMDGGYIPKIPIFVMACHTWYKLYEGDEGWRLKAYIENGQVAGLGVMRTWGSSPETEPGLITDVAPMALIADSVSEFWQYEPSAGYAYPFNLDYADYKFFVWSFNRLMASDMFYDGAAVTPAAVGSWNMTAAEVAELLSAEVEPIDPEPQPEMVTILKTEYTGLLLKAETLGKIEQILGV